MVRYIPKEKKKVILLSSAHHDDKTNAELKKKPEIILSYNKYKGEKQFH